MDEVGFALLDDTGAQLLFRLVSAAYERRALGVASHWPFDQWGRFLPEHTTAVSPPSASWTACSITRMWSSQTAIPTACARPEYEEEPP